MKYSLAYQGWGSLTAEGGSLGTIEIQHDGRHFKADIDKVLHLSFVDIEPKTRKDTGQKYYVVSTRAKRFVKVVFIHSSGCKGVRLIQTYDKIDQIKVKEMFLTEWILYKGISEDNYSIQLAMMPEAEEVDFTKLEE